MLYAFGFGRVGVVTSDLYLIDPTPDPGPDGGSEQGVRLEVRVFEAGELPGSMSSARPIAVGRPIWRADLLETLGNPGSLDRAHHHPRFERRWEPGMRHFVDEMTADPIAFVGARLSDLDGLLADAGFSSEDVDPSDAGELRNAVPEILDAVERLLRRVRAGEYAQTPNAAEGVARVGWL